MLARFSAFGIWALIAGTAVFWGLRLFVSSPPAPPHSVAIDNPAAGRGDLTRLFGAPVVAPTVAAVTPQASARFRLLGIMASRQTSGAPSATSGLALIAVDGKPPRAYAVGSAVDSNLVLQAVSLRTASIGAAHGGQKIVLEIPPLPEPTSGTLAPVGAPVPPIASGTGTGLRTGTTAAGVPSPPLPGGGSARGARAAVMQQRYGASPVAPVPAAPPLTLPSPPTAQPDNAPLRENGPLTQ